MMLTEKDEFICHDADSPCSDGVRRHKEVSDVMGAGDGGTVRELTRCRTMPIEKIDMVEIDSGIGR